LRGKTKSVVLTEERLARAERLFGEMFRKRMEASAKFHFQGQTPDLVPAAKELGVIHHSTCKGIN
jgi:hypothetical protein